VNRLDIFDLIHKERRRQATLWNQPHDWGYGDVAHPIGETIKLAVLLEEVGEVARNVLEKESPRDELVQVAAVAVAWLEGLDV